MPTVTVKACTCSRWGAGEQGSGAVRQSGSRCVPTSSSTSCQLGVGGELAVYETAREESKKHSCPAMSCPALPPCNSLSITNCSLPLQPRTHTPGRTYVLKCTPHPDRSTRSASASLPTAGVAQHTTRSDGCDHSGASRSSLRPASLATAPPCVRVCGLMYGCVCTSHHHTHHTITTAITTAKSPADRMAVSVPSCDRTARGGVRWLQQEPPAAPAAPPWRAQGNRGGQQESAPAAAAGREGGREAGGPWG